MRAGFRDGLKCSGPSYSQPKQPKNEDEPVEPHLDGNDRRTRYPSQTARYLGHKGVPPANNSTHDETVRRNGSFEISNSRFRRPTKRLMWLSFILDSRENFGRRKATTNLEPLPGWSYDLEP